MRECEKGRHKARATVQMKTSVINSQYLSHFCINFYATEMRRSTVKDVYNGI